MKYIIFVLVFLAPYFSNAQNNKIVTDQPFPVDPAITKRVLPNGLTYYIRHNEKPEDRAELRLVVNAGSILEEKDQLGLAHFVEHMAFNGTANFKKQDLVNYLESIGMRFGPDLNAYTSFDETVYMLQVPTDRPGALDTAFQILEDWAHLVQMESEEIDKERGVVIEEWRLGRGAMARMRDIQFPVLFQESRYAERLPIGKVEVLEKFKYEALRRFYYKWYRPDLMAVIAVGDFEVAYVDSLVQFHFANLRPQQEEISRIVYPVPNHSETLIAIATDPEATGSTIGVFYKHPVFVQKKQGDYRTILVQILYNTMFNQRLQELLQQVDPPFLYGYSTKSQIVRSKAFYLLGAGVKGSEFERALETLLIEAKRVRQFGFTESELKRAKQEMLRSIEKAFLEKDKTNSPRYAAEYIRNFLQQEPIPGVEFEFEMHKQFLPTIELTEINQLASEWISDSNRVVLLAGPENDQITIPTEEELAEVFSTVDQTTVAAFTDKVADRPLFDQNIAPGTIVDEEQIESLGVLEWQLSNGVRVILKQTDFKNDEVQFTAISPGGHSLVPDSNYIAALTASSLIQQSGVNGLNQIELNKLLSGKLINVSPYLGELQEGLSGSSSPRDLETLFQLIHLYFTQPRMDSTAFQSYITRMKSMLENRDASPEVIFNDTIQVTMSQSNYRRRPWQEEMFAEMDMQKSLDIYRERFADASDFTFIFVGNLEMENMRTLATTYLGSLPALNRNETWTNLKIRPPRGIIKKVIKRGLEPKARVQINFTGALAWSRVNRYKLNAMASVLRIKLREVLREDKGGTYGVGVNAFASRIPEERYRILITFGCDPDRVDELIDEVYTQIDLLKNEVVEESYLNKVKQSQLLQRQKNLKENSFWLNQLGNYYFYNEDPMRIFQFESMVEALSESEIQVQAKNFLDKTNVITFILLPENSKN